MQLVYDDETCPRVAGTLMCPLARLDGHPRVSMTPDGRSGALMHHFENLTATQRQGLLTDGDTAPYSLANVLRLRRPFVVVDEAHNNRTELALSLIHI